MASIALPIEQILGAQNETARSVERVTGKPVGRFGLMIGLWSCFRALKSVLSRYDDLENRLDRLDKNQLPQIEGPISRLLVSAENLHDSIGRLGVSVKRSRYWNWTPVGAAMMAIRGADETLLDYIDWLQASFDPDLEEDIRDARAAWDRGETHPIG